MARRKKEGPEDLLASRNGAKLGSEEEILGGAERSKDAASFSGVLAEVQP